MGLFSRIRRLLLKARSPAPVPIGDDRGGRPIRARYDAAQQGGMNENHWAAADALDADSAHSVAVRRRLVQRSRYETGNNGYMKGTQRSISNFVIGRGPKLRMLTGDPVFNRLVEAGWESWAKETKLASKLRTARKVKFADGEAFLVVRTNPALADSVSKVKLDVVGVECERVTSPGLMPAKENRIDGIDFDEWGNPAFYHILRYSPGGMFPFGGLAGKEDLVPARFVVHLFTSERWEHRGVPECTSTLNLSAISRRYREAVVVAAENLANFSLLLRTQGCPNEGPPVPVTAMASLPIDKGMMTGLPLGYDVTQPRAEQPPATYPEFIHSQIAEQVRPAGLSYGMAACDSSGYSFSAAKLDNTTFFEGTVEVDQADLEEQALDPIFYLWFAEANQLEGWNVPASPAAHGWDWPAKPEIDELKAADARARELAFGTATLTRVYAQRGLDFEDELPILAKDYGITVDEMRARLLEVILSVKAAPAPPAQPEEPDEPPPPSRRNGSRANGRNRLPVGAS